MKAIIIAGNIGKDAVLRETQNGSVLGFSVAVEDRTGKEKRTIWFDVSMFGKRGEALKQFCTKGTRVCVCGDFSTREYEGKTYLTVNASDITLQGGGDRRDDQPHDGRSSQSAAHVADDLDDAVPF